MTEQESLELLESKLTEIKTAVTTMSEQIAEKAVEERTAEMIERFEKLETQATDFEKQIEDIHKAALERKIPDEDKDETAFGGFKTMDQFLYQIIKAGPNNSNVEPELQSWRDMVRERAASTTSQSAGDSESGGDLIPTEWSNQLLDNARAETGILQNAFNIPMSYNRIEIPYLDGYDQSSGYRAGNVLFYWKGEEAAYEASKFKVKTIALNLHKCTGLAYMTDELIKFSPQAVESILRSGFQKGLNRAINYGCLRGTGAGQPLGIINAPCKVAVAIETGQAADTFVYENMLKMYARNYSESEDGMSGTWYANRTLIPQFGIMNVTVGTGGSAVFTRNVQESPRFMLWGAPVRFSQHMSAVGTAFDIGLFDWSQYGVGLPRSNAEMRMETSIHLKFDYDQTAFKFTYYMDGQPLWPTYFTPENGDTQSPFVTLAAR